MYRSSIQWTDSTWNPVLGCSPVSEGCRNCYAASMAYRFRETDSVFYHLADRRCGRAVFNGGIHTNEAQKLAPLTWRKGRLVFVGSMTDIFHENIPDFIRTDIFAVIAACPQHVFQMLTKRPKLAVDYFRRTDMASLRTAMRGLDLPGIDRLPSTWPLPNVWMGASMENQPAANERMGDLLRIPAVVRFASVEPMLGPISLRIPCAPFWGGKNTRWTLPLDWVIAGGESGPGARVSDPRWFRNLRDECAVFRVPFLFKQWGEFYPDDYEPDSDRPLIRAVWSDGVKWHPSPRLVDRFRHDATLMVRVGKKRSGRLLDGREHNAFPVQMPTHLRRGRGRSPCA